MLAIDLVDHVDGLREEGINEHSGRREEDGDAQVELDEPRREHLGGGEVDDIEPDQGGVAVLTVVPDDVRRGIGDDGEAERPVDPDDGEVHDAFTCWAGENLDAGTARGEPGFFFEAIQNYSRLEPSPGSKTFPTL